MKVIEKMRGAWTGGWPKDSSAARIFGVSGLTEAAAACERGCAWGWAGEFAHGRPAAGLAVAGAVGARRAVSPGRGR
jgi:hypothetical protein